MACVLWLPAQAGVFLTTEQALDLAFPKAQTVQKKTTNLSADSEKKIKKLAQVGQLDRSFTYYTGMKDGVNLGYAVIADVRGKSQPITYMVVIDAGAVVKSVEILAYRESHGGEVRQRHFLGQFRGKKFGDRLRINSDIRHISGATLSCRAITDGVRVILATLNVILAEGNKAEVETPVRLADRGADGPYRRVQYLMGTLLEITLYAPDRIVADRAISATFTEVARVERLLSTWRPESEISRLNHQAGISAVPVGAEVAALLARSRQIAVATDGAFDISIGPLVRLWKEAARQDRLPTAAEIRMATTRIGIERLVLDGGTARLRQQGMTVDLGGIGKGYALDRAAATLAEYDITAALLNFGGQLLAAGPPPKAAGWPILVRDPRRTDAMLTTVWLSRGSIATSADYERGLIINGHAYSHIIDPRSGKPAVGTLSATAIALTATEADAWSTALFVLGGKRGTEMAQQQGIAVLLVSADGSVTRTADFRVQEETLAACLPLRPNILRLVQ